MDRYGLKRMVWPTIVQRAWQYCESNNSGCISSKNQNQKGWFLSKLSRGLTLLTHLFILLRLLLILKLLVKSNRKVFFLTGLVFKNEHMKFMSQKWDLSRERRVVESGNWSWKLMGRRNSRGSEKVPDLTRFYAGFFFFLCVFQEQEGKIRAKETWTYHFLLSS